MHTIEVGRLTSECAEKVMAGEMTPEASKAVSNCCRESIANWLAQIKYAVHTGRVAKIAELESELAVKAKRAA